MRKLLMIIAGSWIVFFQSATALAQLAPVVTASIDRDSILIGQPVRLVFDVKTDHADAITWPDVDSIPHFDLLGKGKVDSATTADNNTYQLIWQLTSFDSGRQVIPSFAINVGSRRFQTDSLVITVGFPKIDSAQDYHDIKEIVDIKNPNTRYIPWILFALTLLSGFGFVYWTQQRDGETTAIGETPVAERKSAYDEAMASLAELKKMPLTDPAQVKQYYTGLKDTLRRFVLRKLKVSSMERTNEELIQQLSKEDIPKESFNRLADALRMSDFVKFAKYIPDHDENLKNLEVIRSSIQLFNETGK